jgi:hypothetical protein
MVDEQSCATQRGDLCWSLRRASPWRRSQAPRPTPLSSSFSVRSEAGQAAAVSRRYLEIICKAVQGRPTGDATARNEANAGFDRFVDARFTLCRP